MHGTNASRRSFLKWAGIGGVVTISGGIVAVARARQAPADARLLQSLPTFDAARAYRDLQQQCAFGARVPGTDGHRRCLAYLEREIGACTGDVQRQNFTFQDQSRLVPMTNLIGRFSPAATRRVLLAAHWDTRPSADEDPNPANRGKPIPGADDGASGVAVLLEIARALTAWRPSVGVDIVFFDGEDYGPTEDRMYLGASYFATHLPVVAPAFGILLDMVGQKDLVIYQEKQSLQYAGAVVNHVWNVASTLGYERYFPRKARYAIDDDHVPLLKHGIPMIDLIDFDYPYWHTLADTPDKCSPESLAIVGRVVLGVLATA